MENKPTLDDLFKQAEAKAQVNVNTQPSSTPVQPMQMQSRILKHSQEPMDLNSHLVYEQVLFCKNSLNEHTKSSKPDGTEDK